MPYTWTSIDTRNSIIASLLPTGVAVVGAGFIGSQRNLQAFNKVIASHFSFHRTALIE